MDFRLRGAALSITPAAAATSTATRDVPPTPIDGRNKYFVELHGRRFPIKQVLRLVTGSPPVGFGAQDAHRILSRLGFDIIEDHGPPPAGTRTLPRVAGSPASLVDPGAKNQDDGKALRTAGCVPDGRGRLGGSELSDAAWVPQSGADEKRGARQRPRSDQRLSGESARA